MDPAALLDDWRAVPVAALAGLLVVAWAITASVRRRVRRAREAALYPPPGCGTDADVGRLLDAGEKMLAIRLYRELYPVDLKSAKAAVEELARSEHRGVR